MWEQPAKVEWTGTVVIDLPSGQKKVVFFFKFWSFLKEEINAAI